MRAKVKFSKKVIFNFLLCSVVLAGCATQTTSLIGTWEDIEAPGFGIEFSQFRFRSFWFGEIHDSGTYEASFGNLTLHYDDKCGQGYSVQCTVNLGYEVTSDTIIITDSIGDLIYRRVE